MDAYFFKLVCINENNPFEYEVLEDVNIGTLDDVHKYISEHIKNYAPESTKWILLPMRKMMVTC